MYSKTGEKQPGDGRELWEGAQAPSTLSTPPLTYDFFLMVQAGSSSSQQEGRKGQGRKHHRPPTSLRILVCDSRS